MVGTLEAPTMANRQRDPKKEAQWRRTLARWRKSGLTIRDFCSAEGVSEPSFYLWRRELQRRDQSAAPTFVPVRVVSESAPAPAVTALEIVTPSGHVVRVGSGFDAATLHRLLAALTERPSC
jgi:hypothetical protein